MSSGSHGNQQMPPQMAQMAMFFQNMARAMGGQQQEPAISFNPVRRKSLKAICGPGMQEDLQFHPLTSGGELAGVNSRDKDGFLTRSRTCTTMVFLGVRPRESWG